MTEYIKDPTRLFKDMSSAIVISDEQVDELIECLYDKCEDIRRNATEIIMNHFINSEDYIENYHPERESGLYYLHLPEKYTIEFAIMALKSIKVGYHLNDTHFPYYYIREQARESLLLGGKSAIEQLQKALVDIENNYGLLYGADSDAISLAKRLLFEINKNENIKEILKKELDKYEINENKKPMSYYWHGNPRN